MEEINLDHDMVVFCIKAKSFPNGVLEAHQKLHNMVSPSENRNYFGISHPNHKGEIIYKAGADELYNGELKTLNLEQIIIKKGKYSCITIKDFMENIPKIGAAFETLLKHKYLDPNGCCIEWYLSNNNDCRCMIKLV